MNTRLIKNIAMDLFIVLPLIYFGGYEKHELAESAMQFVFWSMTVMCGLVVILSKSIKESKEGIDIKKKTEKHLAYNHTSAFLESCALFSLGYPVLAITYMVTGLLYIHTAQGLSK